MAGGESASSGGTDPGGFEAVAVRRLESSTQQMRWAQEDIEGFFVVVPRRWWRRTPSQRERSRSVEQACRALVDVSGDLLVFGLRSELALQAATAATNCLAGAFGRTQIADFIAELTITEAAARPDVSMPWPPAQLEQVLRESAHLARRVLTATQQIVTDPGTSTDVVAALQHLPLLLRGLEEQYVSLAEKVHTT
ncbi:hypothetical protein [Nocardia fluminea]